PPALHRGSRRRARRPSAHADPGRPAGPPRERQALRAQVRPGGRHGGARPARRRARPPPGAPRLERPPPPRPPPALPPSPPVVPPPAPPPPGRLLAKPGPAQAA